MVTKLDRGARSIPDWPLALMGLGELVWLGAALFACLCGPYPHLASIFAQGEILGAVLLGSGFLVVLWFVVVLKRS